MQTLLEILSWFPARLAESIPQNPTGADEFVFTVTLTGYLMAILGICGFFLRFFAVLFLNSLPQKPVWHLGNGTPIYYRKASLFPWTHHDKEFTDGKGNYYGNTARIIHTTDWEKIGRQIDAIDKAQQARGLPPMRKAYIDSLPD